MSNLNNAIQRGIAPFPINDGRGFGFTSKDLNTMMRNEYWDDLDFWQRNFGLYGFMQINRLNKFVVWSPQGAPLMWQPYKACAYDTTGSLSLGKLELEPEPIYMNEKLCHDELLNSCFEHWIDWRSNGDIDMTEEGRRFMGLLIDETLANAGLGLRYSLTTGQMFNVNTVNFSDTVTDREIRDFKKTHGTLRGWIKLAYDLAATKYPWLNQSIVSPGEFDSQTGFSGDILNLYDRLYTNAPRQLQTLVNQGMRRAGRFVFRPLFVVSDSYYNAVLREWADLSTQPMTNRTRLTEQTIGTGENAMRVFYIDGRVPIVNLADINGFDQYTKNNTHFAGIVASGNIQMGLSFSGIPTDVETNNTVSVMVNKVTDPTRDDYGTIVMRSHALGLAAIADADYMSSTILTTTTEF